APIDANTFRRCNANADTIPLHRHQSDSDIAVDHDLFTNSSAKYQHAISPPWLKMENDSQPCATKKHRRLQPSCNPGAGIASDSARREQISKLSIGASQTPSSALYQRSRKAHDSDNRCPELAHFACETAHPDRATSPLRY